MDDHTTIIVTDAEIARMEAALAEDVDLQAMLAHACAMGAVTARDGFTAVMRAGIAAGRAAQALALIEAGTDTAVALRQLRAAQASQVPPAIPAPPAATPAPGSVPATFAPSRIEAARVAAESRTAFTDLARRSWQASQVGDEPQDRAP